MTTRDEQILEIHRARELLRGEGRQNGTRPGRQFEILSYDQLQGLEPPAPLINGILHRNTLATLVGLRSTYKSFLALDWSLCVATGRPWLGRRVHQGTVLYIAAEGAFGVRKRVAAWLRANEHADPPPILFVPQRVCITDGTDVTALLHQLPDNCLTPALIVIDTVARNFGGNESAQEDMQRFVEGCDQLRTDTGATVLAIHHMGWEGTRSRGSTVLPDSADSEFTVTRDGTRITLKNTKQKDDADGLELKLDAIPVADSLVLIGVGVDDVTPTANQTKALTALQHVGGSDGLSSGEWKDATSIPPSSYYAVVSWLTEHGYVEKRRKTYQLTDRGRIWITPNSKATPNATPKPGPVQLHNSNPFYKGVEFGVTGDDGGDRA